MIEGTLNKKQRKIYDMIKDIISDDILVEPFGGGTISLSGHIIHSTYIRDMLLKGLIVYYANGVLAVYIDGEL